MVLKAFPDFPRPKTKDAQELLEAFNKEGKKVLVILDLLNNEALSRSFGNIDKCRAIHWQNLNPFDLFNSDVIITDQTSLLKIEAWLLNRKLRKGQSLQEVEEVLEKPNDSAKEKNVKASSKELTEKSAKKSTAEKTNKPAAKPKKEASQ